MSMWEYTELLDPPRVWSRHEVLETPSPVPESGGVYAWWFRELPGGVIAEGCLTSGGLTLLYIGISPRKPPKNRLVPSDRTLRSRIKYHYSGNARGSTLRLSLGCLLKDRLGIELRRVGSGNRMTFAEGEGRLSQWMEEHAFVSWSVCAEPWTAEKELIRLVSLPLNLAQNKDHPFHHILSEARRQARQRARALPVVTAKR